MTMTWNPLNYFRVTYSPPLHSGNQIEVWQVAHYIVHLDVQSMYPDFITLWPIICRPLFTDCTHAKAPSQRHATCDLTIRAWVDAQISTIIRTWLRTNLLSLYGRQRPNLMPHILSRLNCGHTWDWVLSLGLMTRNIQWSHQDIVSMFIYSCLYRTQITPRHSCSCCSLMVTSILPTDWIWTQTEWTF